MNRLNIVCILTIGLLLSTVADVFPGLRPEIEPAVEFQTERRCFFAGQRSTFQLRIKTTEANGRVPHAVRGILSVNRRTAGVTQTEFVKSDNGLLKVDLDMDIPPVKSGVVIPAMMEVQILSRGSPAIMGRCRKQLYLFHPDPFRLRQTWLEELQLRLYAPSENCTERFQAAGIPFKVIHNQARIGAFTGGILVIGNDISLNKRPGLFKQLKTAAQNGNRVFCLGFVHGTARLPGLPESNNGSLTNFKLSQSDILRSFDKRFDLNSWSTGIIDNGNNFELVVDNGKVVLNFYEGAGGWQWYEAQYENGGRLIISGLPIIEAWDTSPVPKYLFLQILKSLARTGTAKTQRTNQPCKPE